MSFASALLVVFLSGFVALSYEIVWFRVYSFVTGGSASGFGVLLGAYLTGIAFGSLWSRRFCNDAGPGGDPSRLRVPAALVVVSTVAAFAVVPLVAWSVRQGSYLWTLPVVALVAGLMGAVLPLVAHFGIAPDGRAGARLSYLYLANILGSALGSLTTGFVLLDRFSLVNAALVLGFAGMLLGLVLVVQARLQGPLRLAWLGGVAAMTAGLVLGGPMAYAEIYEKLQFKKDYKAGAPFKHVVESRHGVITVAQDDAIYGGGMYDGRFNTDLVHDTNMVVRAYAVPGLHPSPKRVLMVGLSSGSWAQIIGNMPGLEKLTVIEISPGYLELIANYPAVASLLTNPKVEVVIDDGRRWLTAHPEAKFDVVVQNTTWHWRGQITNLLSYEYMTLVKHHLQPGGLFFYNTTDSIHALKTGCATFRHGMRVINFLAGSEAPVQLEAKRWREALLAWRIDGKPVLDPSQSRDAARLDELLAMATRFGSPSDSVEPCRSIVERSLTDPFITDDNMVSEWARQWWEMP